MKAHKVSHRRSSTENRSAQATTKPQAAEMTTMATQSSQCGEPISQERLLAEELLQKHHTEIKALEEGRNVMGSDLESLRKKFRAQEHIIFDLQEKIETVSSEYKKCSVEKERSDLELQKLREAHHELNNKYCQLEVTYDTTIVAQTGELEELKKCVAQHDELQQTVATAIAQERIAQKQMQATMRRLQEGNKVFADYQREVNKEKQAHSEAYDAIQEKLRKEIDLNKNLNAVLEENKKDLVGTLPRIDKITTQLAGQEALIVALKQNKERIETDAKKIIAKQAFKIREIERVCDQSNRAVRPSMNSSGTLPDTSGSLMPPPGPLKSTTARNRGPTKRSWNSQQQQPNQMPTLNQSTPNNPARCLISAFSSFSSSENDSSSIFAGSQPPGLIHVPESAVDDSFNAVPQDDNFVGETSSSEPASQPPKRLRY